MTIEKKNCDECIFKRYTFDKNGKGNIPICLCMIVVMNYIRQEK